MELFGEHKASANHYKNGCRHPACREAMKLNQRKYRQSQGSQPFRDKAARSGVAIEWPEPEE